MRRTPDDRSQQSATYEDTGQREAQSLTGKLGRWVGSTMRQGVSSLWEIGKSALLYALVGAAVAGIVVLLTGMSYGLGLIGVGILAALGSIFPHGRAGSGHFSGPGGRAADAAVHDHYMSSQSSNPRSRQTTGKLFVTALLLIGAGVLVTMLSG